MSFVSRVAKPPQRSYNVRNRRRIAPRTATGARLLFVIVWALLLGVGSARAAALGLVLAIDVSASVSPDSYILQREGIAQAFEDPHVARAIAAEPGGIEALLLEWSDPEKISVAVDWRHIEDAASGRAFAAAVRDSRRSSHGLTAIGPALLAAAAQFARLKRPVAHRIIDISGDGIADFGLAPAIARNRVTRRGITINGLAILTTQPGLEGYYRAEVIGGPGAFVLAAKDFASFAEAMRRKLRRELVAGAAPPARLRSVQMQ